MKTFILSCEHASALMPKEHANMYSYKFLNSHRGYDQGALDAFSYLKEKCHLWGIAGIYSRLLIDLNRSITNQQLFSIRSSQLDDREKKAIINQIYKPYRHTIQHKIDELLRTCYSVIHLSIHSFTPVFKKTKRTCDIGLLFDPEKFAEQQFCLQLKERFNSQTSLSVSFNEPYAGTDDGLTTALRKNYNHERYLGIEIEFNQMIFSKKNQYHQALQVITQMITQNQKNHAR